MKMTRAKPLCRLVAGPQELKKVKARKRETKRERRTRKMVGTVVLSRDADKDAQSFDKKVYRSKHT